MSAPLKSKNGRGADDYNDIKEFNEIKEIKESLLNLLKIFILFNLFTLFALSFLTHLRWLDFTLYVSSSRLGKTQTSLVLLSLRSVGCFGSASRKRVPSP